MKSPEYWGWTWEFMPGIKPKETTKALQDWLEKDTSYWLWCRGDRCVWTDGINGNLVEGAD